MMSSVDSFLNAIWEWNETFMRNSVRGLILYSKKSGLSMSHIGALFHIYHGSANGVSDIGDHLGVTCAAASQMLERLVQQGLVLRSEDPSDRRAKRIILTDKGQRALQDSFHVRQNWLEDLSHSLTHEEEEQVVMALKILIEKADLLEESLA
jgi:DNA-binding MarR family transcriptional regulator